MENKELDTEKQILLSAEKEFLTKGFAGARTTSIAEAAGVTHAMFHYYFRTKEKLFDQIIYEKIGLLKELVNNSFGNSDASLQEKIRNIIEKHLDFIAQNPDLPRFLIVEVFGHSERLQAVAEKVKHYAPMLIATLQEEIDEAAERGEIRRVDAQMLMIDIMSLNIFSSLAAPMLNIMLDNYVADFRKFLEKRKRENYETIMKKLKP